MGVPYGLKKATNYYNKIEAWKDWQRLAEQAAKAGHGDLVEKYRPPETAGWRRVDKCIAKLRDAIAALETEQPA